MKKTLTTLTLVAATTAMATPTFDVTVKADTNETLPPVEPSITQVTTEATVSEPTLEEAKELEVAAKSELVKADTSYQTIQAEVAETTETLSNLASEDEQLEAAINKSDQELGELQADLKESEAMVEEAKDVYEKELAKNPTLNSEIEQAENEVEESKQKQETLTQELTSIKETIAALEQAEQSREATISEVETTVQTTLIDLATAHRDAENKQASLDLAKSDLEKTQAQVSQRLEELKETVASSGEESIVHTQEINVASVNISQLVDNRKDMYHEAVIYKGERTQTIQLTPEQLKEYKDKGYFTYNPDSEKITEHMSRLLTELRLQNGIDIPVPPVSSEAIAYAQARAAENDNRKYLSHDTLLDETYRNSENAGVDNIVKQSNSTFPILSDEQMAYYLLNTYFADYQNAFKGAGSVAYGHRLTLLTGHGDSLGNGFSGRYHVMNFMDFSQSSKSLEMSNKYWDVLMNFSYDDNTEQTMYYKGNRLTFLPKTTFNYVTTVTEVIPNQARKEAEQALKDYEMLSQQLVETARAAVTTAEAGVQTSQTNIQTMETRLVQLQDRLDRLREGKLNEELILANAAALRLQAELAQANSEREAKELRLATLSSQAKALLSSKAVLDQTTQKIQDLKKHLADTTKTNLESKERQTEIRKERAELTDKLEVLLGLQEQAKTAYHTALEAYNKAKSQVDSLEVKSILTTVLTSNKTTQSEPSVKSPEDKEAVVPSGQTAKVEPVHVQPGRTLQNAEKASSTQNSSLAHLTSQTQRPAPSVQKPQPSETSTLPKTGETAGVLLSGIGLLLSSVGALKLKRRD